MSCRQT